MDTERRERLKRMLENGEISREMYDEILMRWDQSGPEEKQNEQDENSKESRTVRSERIHVSGAGKFSSIYSTDVSVSGLLTVENDLDSDRIHVSGKCSVKKNLICSGFLESSGSLSVEGDMMADHLDSSGSIRVKGSIKAGSVEVSGVITARSLKCTDAEISGGARIEGGIESDSIDSSGFLEGQSVNCRTLKSSGSLKSDEIRCDEAFILGKIESKIVRTRRFSMEIYNTNSSVGELYADVVEIEARRRRFLKGEARIDRIVCKKALLEFTTAKYVSGDEVFIGDGCKIDYVEAKSMKISEKARVLEKKIITD